MAEKLGINGRFYLLLKANASQLPLRDSSISLVIATPPLLGEKRVRKGEYCTRDPGEYHNLIAGFLAEATRVVKPYGYIVLHTRKPETRTLTDALFIVFDILQKRGREGSWTLESVTSETFRTHYADVKNFSWEALPIWLYRALIHRYSNPGETVAHVFSGSGNGGIAAIELARRPFLLDLHYHRQILRRLKKKIESKQLKIAPFTDARANEVDRLSTRISPSP